MEAHLVALSAWQDFMLILKDSAALCLHRLPIAWTVLTQALISLVLFVTMDTTFLLDNVNRYPQSTIVLMVQTVEVLLAQSVSMGFT